MSEGARQANEEIRHRQLVDAMDRLAVLLTKLEPLLRAASVCNERVEGWRVGQPTRCNKPRGHDHPCGRVEWAQTNITRVEYDRGHLPTLMEGECIG